MDVGITSSRVGDVYIILFHYTSYHSPSLHLQYTMSHNLHEPSAHDLSRRVATCTSPFTFQKKFHFLDSMITGDEKWVLYDNPVRKQQWVDIGEEPEATPKADLDPKKVLLSYWWSRRGMEYWELLERGQTIDASTYVTQLRKLKDHVDRTQKNLLPS